MKQELRALAEKQGFAMCQVAAVHGPLHTREYDAWLAKGHHADMAWLERGRDKRVDPELVLPGVRSVVVLATSYWQGAANPHRQGRIARYAWGEDYHEPLLERMRPLDALMAQAGGRQKCYVDTGPVLERDFAALAGIGWHGKSTMLLNQGLGTWFFLSEILTTLELEPDRPVQAHCGKCTRCMQACPTGALTSAHVLDARRCISWMTIENKSSIPVQFRRAVGDRIYGCDACLDACPWNRFAQRSRDVLFAASQAVTTMRLRDYLALDVDSFRELFRRSPIRRIKLPRLQRNVCVALGNVGNAEDIAALERVAAGADEMLAEHARWAIDEITARTSAAGTADSTRSGNAAR